MSTTSVVVATWPFAAAAVAEALRTLCADDTIEACEHALVAGLAVAERDEAIGPYFVGVGGLPNAAGNLELDAAIMRGRDCRFGAVLGLQSIATPAAVAYAVLTDCRHNILAGDGALAFAREQGFASQDISGVVGRAAFAVFAAHREAGAVQPALTGHDTLGMLVVHKGNVAAAVSTSGMAFKRPGRVGDSALPGAGLYADSECGAAAATGDGDQILRFGPTLQVVKLMGAGFSPDAACDRVITDIRARLARHGEAMFELALVAVNTQGVVGAGCTFTKWHDHVTGKSWPGFPYCVAVASGDSEQCVTVGVCVKIGAAFRETTATGTATDTADVFPRVF